MSHFNLPWWDRLFGTYRDQPQSGHLGMTIGLPGIRDPRDCVRLWGLLKLPFVANQPSLNEIHPPEVRPDSPTDHHPR